MDSVLLSYGSVADVNNWRHHQDLRYPPAPIKHDKPNRHMRAAEVEIARRNLFQAPARPQRHEIEDFQTPERPHGLQIEAFDRNVYQSPERPQRHQIEAVKRNLFHSPPKPQRHQIEFVKRYLFHNHQK